MELTVTVAEGSFTVPVTVVGLRLRKLRFVGDVSLTVGTGAYVRLRVLLVEFPARSVAATVVEFAPAVKATAQLKLPPLIVAGEPLQVTRASPDRASEACPLTT